MSSNRFDSTITPDGRIAVPAADLARLGLRAGDIVRVSVERVANAHDDAAAIQEALQARFDALLDEIESAELAPRSAEHTGEAASAFAAAMDEKFHRLGFHS